jgi:UDP:flavonoid glycosyltransferase YjiC (YdhE family)
MDTQNKANLLICSAGMYGQVMPMLAIARAMIEHGYKVTFLTASSRREAIEEIGASFIPLSGYANFTEANFQERWPIRGTLATGHERLAWDLENIFAKSVPSQFEGIQRALEFMTSEHPAKPIIGITAGWFYGPLAVMLKAPGLRPVAWISIGLSVVALSGDDVAPFGLGLLPDRSQEGRRKNMLITKEHQAKFTQPQTIFQEALESIGAYKLDKFFIDAMYTETDRFIQMCIPSVEYPRDNGSKIRFSGGLPKGHREPMTEIPGWWDGIVANSEKRHIVAVSQGSIAVNLRDLIIPTMDALRDREDIKLVVALGKRGATLPADTSIPRNTHVVDFIPFDDLLPHCDVFITNGGYGAFQHGISNGVPLIVGGSTEDKPEVAARVEWAGFGINLRTGTPTAEEIRRAVDEILSNPKYKKRAAELEAEMNTFDVMKVVVDNIEELVAER